MNENDHDLVGAYALDALSPEEQAQFEHHLRVCPSCQAEAAELRAVVDVLPLGVDQIAPSNDLRDRIVEAARAEPEGRPPLKAIVGGAPPRKERPTRWPNVVIPAVAAAVLLALGAWTVHLQQRIDQQQNVVAFQREVRNAIVSGAAVSQVASTSAAPGALAAVVQPQNGKPARLLVQGLPSTSASRVYQVWLIQGATPHSAGVFTYSGSSPKTLTLTMPSAGYAAAAVTIEPGPRGSPAPTGAKLLLGKLPA